VRQSSLRNVIFDFGGVLVRWKPDEIISGFYADESLKGLVREGVFQHPDWIEMDRGTLSEAVAIERFSARTGRPAEEMRGLMRHVKDSLTPMAESLAIVQDLARRGIPLYGLSNMSTSTFAHLKERYAFWDHFRGIVISGEVRLIKPDPRIFEHIAQRFDLVPSETLFIDDHAPNIESAARQGFRTIRFEDARQCLGELNGHLGGRPLGDAPGRAQAGAAE
jgi:putative hydrolase of the HAD superfamily